MTIKDTKDIISTLVVLTTIFMLSFLFVSAIDFRYIALVRISKYLLYLLTLAMITILWRMPDNIEAN
jgi:hypothetical protein